MEIAILAGSDVFIGSYIYPIQSFSAFLLTISNFHKFILNRRFSLKYIYDKHVEIRTYLHITAKYVFACSTVSIYWIHMECTYRVLILDDTSLADFCIFIPELLFLTIKIGGALFVV